ncbi:MAG: ParA family protein [Desulfobacteraceae bacterium]|nr:ParA family protein [Desulfobacteraceae bacterium]
MTISGQKGGSGKSVTAVNLAVSLALYGKKILLIDCDPQGSTTKWSGIKALGYQFDLASVLNGKVTIIEAIMNTQFSCLDVLPSGFDLFSVALKLAGTVSNEKILRLFLEDIEQDYDFIIIDAPSSSGFLSVAALTAADWLIIAMSTRYNCVEDFHCLLKLIKYVRDTHKTPLKIARILFNRCKANKEIDRFLVDQNLSEIKDLVCHTFIPEDDAVKKAIDTNIPLALHDIKSPASSAYLNFAKEMVLVFK